MLARLVREAMFHGHEERRHHASVLLRSSPYRAALAAVLADRVTAREAEHGRAMILLSYLAGPSERAQLATVASDATHGGAVRSSALHGLGHVGVEAYADAALAAVNDPQPSVARAALYALGMSGGPEIFELSTASPHSGSVFPEVRRAATWWQRVGPAVRDCAG
jgi:HEAT repeat protein